MKNTIGVRFSIVPARLVKSQECVHCQVSRFCIRFIKLDELVEFNWNQSGTTEGFLLSFTHN